MGSVEKENWFPRTFTSIRLIREGNDFEEEVDILMLGCCFVFSSEFLDDARILLICFCFNSFCFSISSLSFSCVGDNVCELDDVVGLIVVEVVGRGKVGLDDVDDTILSLVSWVFISVLRNSVSWMIAWRTSDGRPGS